MSFNPSNSEILLSAGNVKQFPALPLPQVVFSGRSNVGKSSLLNTLLCRKSLARVSSTPGKTITVNFYKADNRLVLVDLPGYGFAKRPEADKEKWSELTEGFFTKNRNIDLVKLALQLVDLEVGPTEDDLLMINYLKNSGMPFAIVASKADKPNKTNRATALERLHSHPGIPEGTVIIPFSSRTGEGRDEVLRIIFEYCGIKRA